MHFTERECAPQTLSSPAAPYHNNLPPRRKTHNPTPPPRPLACGGVLTCLTKSPSHTKLSGIKTGDILPALIPLNLLFTSFPLMSTEIIAHIFQRAFFKAADLGLADMDFFRHFGLCFAFKKTHVYDMAFPLREPLHGFIQ